MGWCDMAGIVIGRGVLVKACRGYKETLPLVEAKQLVMLVHEFVEKMHAVRTLPYVIPVDQGFACF